MSKTIHYKYSVETDILNLDEIRPIRSHVHKVIVTRIYKNFFGFLKSQDFLIAMIPNDYTDESLERAKKIGRDQLKEWVY